jgi:hypothetical protein
MGAPKHGYANSSTGDQADEIQFLTYRLDVLGRWPASERKDTLIAATLDRLRALGADRIGTAPSR